jgi:hypothetical protein
MRTDAVILVTLTQCGDHTHLEWSCPDCGISRVINGKYAPCRFRCADSDREYLVVGFALQPRVIQRTKEPKFVSRT